jgi:hypothetical protein
MPLRRRVMEDVVVRENIKIGKWHFLLETVVYYFQYIRTQSNMYTYMNRKCMKPFMMRGEGKVKNGFRLLLWAVAVATAGPVVRACLHYSRTVVVHVVPKGR